ncbi:uncharacterized protein PV06_08900 [Exophiala oligosperma]|uniref:Uncharacterized protein n=1 Tax=Exophiala oligosperma TaxID=215243 RepID=A0A0D2DU08_9EURO|nr:uncharacterized protein PV06_08900 [Exophiala oligosperma]KIW39089.1 hypothetical protein PV06_08900 [Exophiala oligosperma]
MFRTLDKTRNTGRHSDGACSSVELDLAAKQIIGNRARFTYPIIATSSRRQFQAEERRLLRESDEDNLGTGKEYQSTARD